MEQLFVSNLSLTDSSANKTHYFVVASSAGDKIGLLNIKPYIRSLAYDINPAIYELRLSQVKDDKI